MQSDFKVLHKPYISLNDIWVRKNLIHPWVLLMVGLGWYLDVFGSESHVLVWVFENFFEKNRKKKENGNLDKMGPFAVAKGTLTVAKGTLAAVKSFAEARPRAKKATPRVHCSVAVLRRNEMLCGLLLFTEAKFMDCCSESLVLFPRQFKDPNK